jgi:hypothetical protein
VIDPAQPPRGFPSLPEHDRAPPEQIVAWKVGFLNFLQQVNLRTNRERKNRGRARRIVLKSPTHTARLHCGRWAENFCELRYEDLIRAPAPEMSRIYQQLGLGSFEQLQPKLKAHLGELNGYKSNQHRISDQQRAAVSRRWAGTWTGLDIERRSARKQRSRRRSGTVGAS